MTKIPVYLKTDLTYHVVVYNLLMKPNIVRKRSKPGIFSFTIENDPIFTDVLIQVTSKGKLNIYIPEDAPEKEIIAKTLMLLSEANQARIKVLGRKEAIAKKPELPTDERVSPWDQLKCRIDLVGGHLVDLTVEKLKLSDTRDPITGWRQKSYTKSPIKGIIVLRGALVLSEVAGIRKWSEHDAVLLTANPVDVGDRLRWRNTLYEVKDFEERLDNNNNFSYQLAYLTRQWSET